jgi:hypothetical protein
MKSDQSHKANEGKGKEKNNPHAPDVGPGASK